MSIADNIKRLRKQYNMSQEEFATIAGVTVSAVSTWELGKREPRMGAIQKIADHFGLKKSDLIEDRIIPLPSPEPRQDNSTDDDFFDEDIRMLARKKMQDASPEERERKKKLIHDLIKEML